MLSNWMFYKLIHMYLGHSDIKPASADEVAKVIAMTQQQMKKSVPQQQLHSPPTSNQVKY